MVRPIGHGLVNHWTKPVIRLWMDRRGGCRGEQESEHEAYDRLPDPKAHVPPGEIDDDADDDHHVE